MVKVEFVKGDFIWIGLIVVLLGVGFGYAFGGNEPAVMGHDVGELDGVCLSDGTNCDVDKDYVDSVSGGSLECVSRSCSQYTSSGGCSVTCPSGYLVTGCGVHSSSPYAVTKNHFLGNGCSCSVWNYGYGTTTCQAMCCR
ncbi:hypothetical protein K8R30_02915 [archaeon]|nr:hypothetical protein [archaeon]